MLQPSHPLQLCASALRFGSALRLCASALRFGSALRLQLRLWLWLLRAGARALQWAPGERREAVESPAGLAAGMRPRFSTGQGWPVRKPRPTHANPLRKDAQRARTRGGLSFGSFSLATQRKGTRAGRRTDRKLLLFASRDQATKRPSKTGASVELMVGQGPPYDSTEVGPAEGLTESAWCSPRASSDEAMKQYRGESGAHGGPGPTPCARRSLSPAVRRYPARSTPAYPSAHSAAPPCPRGRSGTW